MISYPRIHAVINICKRSNN